MPNLGTSTLYSVYASSENNIIVSSTSGNVYITTNAGANWTTSNVGNTATLWDMNFINSSTGYLCGTSGTFRYTTNFGANWAGSNPPTTATLYEVKVVGAEIYTTGSVNPEAIFKSTDNGASWTSMAANAPGQLSPLFPEGFDINGTKMIIAGNYGKMNISTNSGANWSTASYNVAEANMVDIYGQNGSGRVVAIGSLTGIVGSTMYSTNGGTNWSTTPYIAPNVLSDLNMINASTGYFCGRFGIFAKTTNGGAAWDSISASVLWPYFCNGVDFVNENTGWVVGGVPGAGGNTKIFKTTNGGANFTEQTSAYSGPIAVRVKMLNANTGWIVGTNQVQKTTDGGITWVLQPAPAAGWNALTVIDANNVFIGNSNSQVYTTSDGGSNWASINFPVSAGTIFSMDWADANNGMAGAVIGVVCKTTNRGASWQIYNIGGYTVMGIDMVHPDTAYAVCGNTAGAQILKFTRGLTGGVFYQNQIPENYTLSQNYPNPFNPNTIIKFELPKAGKVSLKVFDITGQQVAVLVNDLSMNAGELKVDFDGSELASGIYFYSLFVDNNRIDTKKMVLVK